MTKRIIIITTPTSGTTSLWRIVERFLPVYWGRGWFVDDCLARGVEFEDVVSQVVPPSGCYLFNQPHLFNFDQDLSDTRFILNFRDPRDMSCNQYYWKFSHPHPHLTEQQLADEREAVRRLGLDNFVMSLDHRPLFVAYQKFLSNPALMNRTITTSYARLCFDSSGVVEQLAEFFGCTDWDAIEKAKREEHPSQLLNTEQWIGSKWSGADVFPGRARVELKPETFDALTERYRNILETLQALDKPRYSYFYSD